jgi:hypothetical protein
MRTLTVAAIILALLLGLGIFNYYYIDKSAKNLISLAEKIELEVNNSNWSQAEKKYSNLQSKWTGTGVKWTVLINHQELDNINITMAKVKKFMETKDKPGFMTELAELKLLFRHIPEKEALNLKNVL